MCGMKFSNSGPHMAIYYGGTGPEVKNHICQYVVFQYVQKNLKHKIMSKTYQKYHHFRDRLKLRFEMDISINEYRELCQTKDFLIIKEDSKKITIQIDFKNIKLYCFKDTEENGGKLTTVFKAPV